MAGRLVAESSNFNTAFQAFDQCIWTTSPALALIQLWGGLERLFTTVRPRKTFQLATRISAYLARDETEQHALITQIRELYDARSSCAHGSPSSDDDPLYASYDLVKRVLTAMIEAEHVPSPAELEALGSV